MSSATALSGRSWTVLIFMVVEDSALELFALIDLREIRKISNHRGFDVVVELRWHGSPTERYELREGELRPLSPSNAGSDVDKGAALRTFLQDALHNYPAEHYLLMLWGHAYGFGFGGITADRLAFPELARVLEEFSKHRGGSKLEVLAGNTCRVGKIEAVYELRETVRYLVASQVAVPNQGWPLREILTDLVESPSIEPRDLARLMVIRFCDWYRLRTISMTMIDLDEAELVIARLKTLAETSLAAIDASDDELARLHEAFVQAANDEEETEPVVDLYELCCHLIRLSHNGEVKAAAADLLDVLRSPAFIAKHDGFGPGAEQLHGLGLYVPHVALDVHLPLYAKLGLDHAQMWAEVVSRLRRTQKYAAMLEAITRLEAETLREASASAQLPDGN